MIRRALLLAPLALAACANEPPPRVEGPPIAYGHLTQLRLDVAGLDFAERDPMPGPNDIGRELSPSAAEAAPASRRIAAESLLRQAMFDLNTEFEFQIRRALRPYLVEGPGRAAPPEGGVRREALPAG